MKKNNKIINANISSIRDNKRLKETEIEHTLELKNGWNLVAGSILNACEIKDGNNIIEKEGGNFLIYKFSESGYTRGYSFQQGIGYWVRSREEGQIKLVEKTEGIVKDETVETIRKTVTTIIESSNTFDQTNKDIENIVKPNSTQTSEEVKETINKTGSTLEQQAEKGQNLVNDLDKAVENEDSQLLNDLIDQARDSIPSNGRKKKNKRKAKKKLRIVNEVNKFDTMYNNGKSAEQHCGDWANGNGEYAECSNSLKNYFTSMNEVGNVAKNDQTGYETVTEYYKSNSSGSKIPNGNYQINANWDSSDTFHKIRIYYDELIFVDSDKWIYDRNRKLFTNAYQKDDYGFPVWSNDLGSYQFTYTQDSKWIKFFRVQDDTNEDDDSLYFGITDQYDSNPGNTPLGSFVGVKKEVDWVKYNFKNSKNEDNIEILIGVLEAPIDSDIYKGSVELDSSAFEIKELVIKSSNQDIVDLFKVSNTWTTGAENFDNDNFALHGGLDVKWDNQSESNIYKTFSYNSNSYNFYIKFGGQIEIKMQEGTLYFNEFVYDVNINDGFLFSEIEGTPDEVTNDKFIEFNTTGGINDIWFENQQIDFTEELDWFRYSIENNSSPIPLEMIVEIGVSKNNVSDVTNFYKGDSIKELKEIKEIIFKTSDSEILDKLEDFSWLSLENQNDNNYALFNPYDDAKEYPNSYNENYKFKIYGIKDNFDDNGNYVGTEEIDLFLEKTPNNNYILGLRIGTQLGTPDNQEPLYKYAESASLNETELQSKPTDIFSAYKTFNTKGGLNKVYIVPDLNIILEKVFVTDETIIPNLERSIEVDSETYTIGPVSNENSRLKNYSDALEEIKKYIKTIKINDNTFQGIDYNPETNTGGTNFNGEGFLSEHDMILVGENEQVIENLQSINQDIAEQIYTGGTPVFFHLVEEVTSGSQYTLNGIYLEIKRRADSGNHPEAEKVLKIINAVNLQASDAEARSDDQFFRFNYSNDAEGVYNGLGKDLGAHHLGFFKKNPPLIKLLKDNDFGTTNFGGLPIFGTNVVVSWNFNGHNWKIKYDTSGGNTGKIFLRKNENNTLCKMWVYSQSTAIEYAKCVVTRLACSLLDTVFNPVQNHLVNILNTIRNYDSILKAIIDALGGVNDVARYIRNWMQDQVEDSLGIDC